MKLKETLVLFTVLVLTFTLCTVGCAVQTSSAIVSGSVSGVVLYKNGNSDSNGDITVTLSCADNTKGTQTVITAKDGSYSFLNVDAGIYYIFANDTSSVEKMVKTSVIVSSSEEVKATRMELTGTGSVHGKIRLNGATTGNSGFIVFIAGTTFIAATSDDGSFKFTDIPAAEKYTILLMRGSNTLLYKTTAITVNGATNLGEYTVTSDEITAAAKSFIWKGSYDSPEAEALLNPVLNWAYFNTTSGCSYIYNGTEWTLLTEKGADGKNGENGKDGADGKDGVDGVDGVDGEKGKDGINGVNGINGINGKNGEEGAPGKDGVGIIWKGPRLVPPENPELNWAYFNRTDGISYIWDGKTWQIFCMVYTDKIPPAPVTNVLAAERSGSAQLEWQDPDDDDLYGVIIICTEKGKPIPSVESLASLPPSSVLVAPGTEFYLWSNLTAGTSYTFSLYAVDAAGNKSTVKSVSCAISTKTQGNMSLSIRPNTTVITNQPITATVTCNTTAPSVTSVKYAAGTQYPLYFAQGNGTSLSQSSGTYSFRVRENGTYTVYAKDSEGRQEVANQTITNIDTSPPEPVTNLSAAYNSASSAMEIFWKRSSSLDVSKTILTYVSSAQSVIKELAAETESFSFSCAADNGQYTISLYTVDYASNTSKSCSTEKVASQKPAITTISLSQTKISSNNSNRFIHAKVSGFNFNMIGTTVFVMQTTGIDRTPYTLSVTSDTSASGLFLAPVKEGTYSLQVVYGESVIGSTEFVVTQPPELTKITLDKPSVPVGTKGTITVTISGKNLDLCMNCYVTLNPLSNEQAQTATASGNSQTYTAKLTIPQSEGTYTLSVYIDGICKGTETLLVYGTTVLTAIDTATTTIQNCGKSIPITLHGENLNAPSTTLALVCNGKEYTVRGTSSKKTTVPLIVPIVTSDSSFTVQVKVNGILSNASGTVHIYTAKQYFDETLPLVTVIPSGKKKSVGTSGSTALPENTIVYGYQIGKYPVTAGLWSTIYRWAILNGYSFTSSFDASETLPDNREPMRSVCWRDCIVWCNAYTEWTNAQNGNNNLTCVYYSDSSYTQPLRISSSNTFIQETKGSIDMPYLRPNNSSPTGNTAACKLYANGYRLPSEVEWEYAARGGYSSDSEWRYTFSGSDTLSNVGWYSENSMNSMHEVGLVSPNTLSIFDMSGLVWEWIFDWNATKTIRILRGGCYSSPEAECSVFYRLYGAFPYRGNNTFGFRVAQSN